MDGEPVSTTKRLGFPPISTVTNSLVPLTVNGTSINIDWPTSFGPSEIHYGGASCANTFPAVRTIKPNNSPCILRHSDKIRRLTERFLKQSKSNVVFDGITRFSNFATLNLKNGLFEEMDRLS